MTRTITDPGEKAPKEIASGLRIDIPQLSLTVSATIQEAIEAIDRSGRFSVALLVDAEGRLLNTLTDGDIRRGLLRNLSLQSPVTDLLPIKAGLPNPVAVTAPVGTDDLTLIDLMRTRNVRQVPLVDARGVPVNVVTLAELLSEPLAPLQAVVMAGGLGSRLQPLTAETPKPMLHVGGRPLMEVIVEQLRETGVRKINIATHYQAQKIVEHFGDGTGFGVDIAYVNEETPLGTGGALGLMAPPDDPVLVINGDILTDVDFRAMHAFHQEHDAQMTVAVRRYEVQVPYGVVECDGPNLVGLQEKPQVGFFVNAGIYLIEPEIYRYIPANQHFNMTDLIELLMVEKKTIVSFPVREYWLDIGHHADYARAQEDAANGRWRWNGPGK